MLLIPRTIRVGLAQLVIALLRFVNDVGQMLQVIRARIALDGVHIAEQLCNRGVVGLRMLADDALVLANETGRTLDEVMELLFADRQNFADHVETPALFAGFRSELAQFGHVAHTKHQANNGVALRR